MVFESKRRRGVLIAGFAVVSVAQLYPLIYLFDFSLLRNADFFMSGLFKWPDPPQWGNYVRAWVDGQVPSYFLNSVIVCAATIALTLLLVLMMSYPLVKMSWRGQKVMMMVMLLGMMLPIHITIIPNYTFYQALGIRDSYLSMIIPYVAFNVPFGLFLMAGYLRTIPDSIIESAKVDGCGTYRLIFRIIAPMTTPALSAIGITTFLNCWNEFIMATTFLSSDKYKTLPLSIMKFTSEHGQDLSSQFAVMALSAIPAIVVYLIFSEKITSGIMAGALKG
jgi:raffinose/stachyose/melibiose transport system permease protein